MWCGQQISLGPAQPLLPGSCLRSCEYVPGSCRRTGLHTPVILVPPCPVSARPICSSSGDDASPPAPRCPRSKAGHVQRVLHLLHFSKHCCSRKDSPTRQCLRSSLPGSLKNSTIAHTCDWPSHGRSQGQFSPQMSATAAEIVRAYKNEAEVRCRRLHF